MTDGLILRFRHRYGKKFKVIVTGGFSAHLKPFMDTTQIDIIDPLLSVKSLFAIFKDFNS